MKLIKALDKVFIGIFEAILRFIVPAICGGVGVGALSQIIFDGTIIEFYKLLGGATVLLAALTGTCLSYASRITDNVELYHNVRKAGEKMFFALLLLSGSIIVKYFHDVTLDKIPYKNVVHWGQLGSKYILVICVFLAISCLVVALSNLNKLLLRRNLDIFADI